MGEKGEIADVFAKLAPQYDDTVDHELRAYYGLGYEAWGDRLVEMALVNEGDAVLDIATGTGLIPLKLVDKVGAGGGIWGLDITPAMLEHGRKRIEAAGASGGIRQVCASAMGMPFAREVFDVVICGFGMHHLDVSRMLRETRRVLKAGGRLVMADVGAPAFWRSRWGIALLRILAFCYVVVNRSARAKMEMEALANTRTAGEWRAILSDLSFRDIEVSQWRARRPWYPPVLVISALRGEPRLAEAEGRNWIADTDR